MAVKTRRKRRAVSLFEGFIGRVFNPKDVMMACHVSSLLLIGEIALTYFIISIVPCT
jgi:hypothetical protein